MAKGVSDENEINPKEKNRTPEAPAAPVTPVAPVPTPSFGIRYSPYNPGVNYWEQQAPQAIKDGKPVPSGNLSNYFKDPVPAGIQGFDSGAAMGKNVVGEIYGSEDAKAIWDRLKNESTQGLDAASMKSIKDKYGSQGVMEQAKIQKAGLKGQAALRAGEDLASQRRQEAAAMDAALKKEAFNTMRDEWGRRTLLSANLPIAYGQLGSAASLGQVLQNLAGTNIKA